MFIRRAFYFWQFTAVVALPAWLVVGWPIFGSGGWGVLGMFFGAVGLGLGLLVVSLLIAARRDVRNARAVSHADAAVLTLWHALIIALGFYAAAAPILSVLVIVVGVGAFWLALWEIYAAARRGVLRVMEELERAAKPTSRQVAPDSAGSPGGPPRASHPDVIVITEKPQRR